MRVLNELRRTEFLLRGGLVGPLLFIVVFSYESLTRANYDPYHSMVSELSVGSWGWVQIMNFLMCGVLMLACTLGMWRTNALRLATGVLTITALGMLMAGIFVTDPGLAYPASTQGGVPVATGTWHGLLHGIAGAIVFFSLPIAMLITTIRFARRREFGWLAYTLAALVVGFAAFMAGMIPALHDGPSGVYQRVAIVAYFSWFASLAHHIRTTGLSLATAGQSRTGLVPPPDGSPRGPFRGSYPGSARTG